METSASPWDEGDAGGGSSGRGRRPSPGNGLLARMHQLSPEALVKDGEAQLVDPEAFQEHHLVVDALHLLPYYLTQARHHTRCILLPPRPGHSFPFQLNLTACS
jgi:hypothetical protein